MRWLLAASLLLTGCQPEEDPCATMCEAAADLYGGCLDSWGAGWEAAGYADNDDFVDACETWAWEWRQLERDAGQPGATEEACIERAEAFTTPDAACEAYTGLDWATPPWSAE